MFAFDALAPKPLAWPAPETSAQGAENDALPEGIGGFTLSAYYGGTHSLLSRRQFSGKAVLDLHDPKDGHAAVAIADIGMMSLAYVRSTGHDVSLTEMQRPNVLVRINGTLSSQNDHMRFESADEPWVLFGRGRRRTRVCAHEGTDYEAFVLSLPPSFLGESLHELEIRGGMLTGDTSAEGDLLLARLTLALATQLTLTGKASMEPRLAEAWGTLLTERIERCMERRFGRAGPATPRDISGPTLTCVRRAEELIYDRPDEITGIGDLAIHAGVSLRTLQSAFRAVRGATPTQVLTQARLHRARRALTERDGPESVSAVCRMCGIEHHGRFSKLYKEAFGEAPVATLKARLAG